MRVKEIENLSRKELRQRADDAFAKADEKGLSYLMEAQFYMRELEHRHDSWVSIRDLILEIVVIGLILAEIVEGNAQAKLIAAQTQILQNLQNSTKSTADSLAEQLAIQYRVFVNVQPNGRALSLFNNSKNEVTFRGIKVGNRPAKLNRDRSSPVAGLNMITIPLEQFYPTLFTDLPQTGSVVLPITIYLKSANNEEYVAEGNFTFSKQGIVSGQSTSRAAKWSGTF